MTKEEILSFVQSNWGLLSLALIAGVWIGLHPKLAISYAKGVAHQLIIAAEKRSEELVLTKGPEKLAWVVDKGYDLLPAMVRLFVSKPLFQALVQSLLDDAVNFARQHVTKQVPDTSADQIVHDVVDYTAAASQPDSVIPNP